MLSVGLGTAVRQTAACRGCYQPITSPKPGSLSLIKRTYLGMSTIETLREST